MSPSCLLLGGWFSIAVQAFLVFTAVATLIFKRYIERPQRDWLVWFLDISKQGFGSSLGHLLNILIASLIASNNESDECQWYFLSYISDTTLGTLTNVSLLVAVESWFLNSQYEYGAFKFGDYGSPPKFRIWALQLIVWIAIIICTKCAIVSILYSFSGPLDLLLNYGFYYLRAYPEIELIFVMIVVPFFFNVMAYWITDNFLKKADIIKIDSPDLDKMETARLKNNTNHFHDYNSALNYSNDSASE